MDAARSETCSDPAAPGTRRHQNVAQAPAGHHGSGGILASHDHANGKAELALRVIQGRWKLLILRELEADGVVERTVHLEVPPRVEVALMALGRELIPVLEGLHAWGEKQQSER